jgi:sensor histidine kinase YesM
MNVILGNLLDNAIEGAIKSDEKRIVLEILYVKNVFSIKICNTYNEKEFKNFETTKSDKLQHGIGLKNVKSILKKYNGSLKLKKENEFVVVNVIVYLS